MATIYLYEWLFFIANSWVNYISRIDPLGMTKVNVPNITCRSFQIYTPPKSCFLQIPQKKRCVFLQIARNKTTGLLQKYTPKKVFPPNQSSFCCLNILLYLTLGECKNTSQLVNLEN